MAKDKKEDLKGKQESNKLSKDNNKLADDALIKEHERTKALERAKKLKEKELNDSQELILNQEKIKDLTEDQIKLQIQSNQLSLEKQTITEKLNSLDLENELQTKESLNLNTRLSEIEDEIHSKHLKINTAIAESNELQENNVNILNRRKEPYNSRTLRIIEDIDETTLSITDKTSNMFNLEDRLIESKRDINSLTQMQNELIDQGFDKNTKSLNVMEMFKTSANELAEGFLTMGTNTENLGTSNLKNLNIEDKRVKIAQLKAAIEDDEIKNNAELYSFAQRNLKMQEDQLTTLEKGNAVIERAKTISDSVTGSIESGFNAVNSSLAKLPGGEMLGKMLGVDALGEKIKTEVGLKMTNAFKDAGGGAKGFLSATTSGLSGMSTMLMGPAGILLALTAIIAIGAKLVDMFLSADEAVSEMQKSMEVSKSKAIELQGAATDIAGEIGMVGVNTKEVMESMAGLREAMGGLRIDPTANAEMKGLVEQTTMLTAKYGLSAQESADLYSTSKLMGVSMEELTATAATFGDKTIGSKEALKEMAKLPKGMVAGFKGSVQQLAAAAVKAKMMGTSLERMKAIGDGMLDIESSLNAEMEARILTGKNINLDRARELALAGDVAGLQDEVLSQMGSLEDFKKMDVIAQKSMADAMGMSVDEMTTMLTKAEENKAMGIDSAKMKELEAASYEELNRLAAEGEGKDKAAYTAQLKKMAAEKESASLQEKLSNIMTKIQEKIQKLVLPLVDMAHAFFDSAEGGSMLSDILDMVFGIIGKIFKFVGFLFGILMKIAYPVQIIKAIFSEVLDAVMPLVDEISKLFESTEEGGESVDYIGKAFEIVGDVIGGIASIIAVAIVNPLKFVIGIITSIIKIFTGDFEGGVKGIGDSIKGFIFGPFEKVGEVIDSIFGTNIKKAISGITSSLDPVIDIFSDLYGTYLLGIWKLIKDIGGNILTYLMAPINLVKGLFSGITQIINGDIMGGLQTIGQSILDYILAPFNLVKNIFDSFVNFLQSMIEKVSSFGGIVGGIADGIGGLMSAVGFGGDDKEEKDIPAGTPTGINPDDIFSSGGSEVTPKAEGGAIKSNTGYTLVGEKGPELVQLPNGSNVMTAEQTSGMMGGSGSPAAMASAAIGGNTGGGMNNDKIVSLLEQILAVASQPAMLKLGDAFVHEIDSKIQLRSKMRINTDSTWGNTI
jgi:hypothetical protein